jgi:hypothetical protein
MGEAIARQHPAVVLRSQFNQLRALLAVALIAVAGLTVAVVILANDSDEASSTSAAKPLGSINYGNSRYLNPSTDGGSRYLNPSTDGGSNYLNPSTDGGSNYLNPSTGSPTVPFRQLDHPPQSRIDGTRYDGGPNEGSADVTPAQPQATQQQAFPGPAGAITGDHAHRLIPPAAPAKDYSKNGATGDYSTEPQAQTGSRSDGASDKIQQLRARAGN